MGHGYGYGESNCEYGYGVGGGYGYGSAGYGGLVCSPAKAPPVKASEEEAPHKELELQLQEVL